jgi:hypothetical protein
MSIRYVFDWRTFVIVCGGVTVWINHDACEQYEKKLEPLRLTVDVSSQAGSEALMLSNRASQHKIYGYFEGIVRSSAPLSTPPSPTHGHRSFDMTLMQQYVTTAASAEHRFSPAASIKDCVWLTNPLTKRNKDSGLQVGGVLTVENPQTGVKVQVDQSFLPQMRLKQLFYYDSLSAQDRFLHAGGVAAGVPVESQQSDHRASCDAGEESADNATDKRQVHVVGGLPVGQTVCIIGDFVCDNTQRDTTTHAPHEDTSLTSPLPSISIVSTDPDDEADQRICGSFFGSFEDVNRAKQGLYEKRKQFRLAGGVAAAGALVLMILFPL